MLVRFVVKNVFSLGDQREFHMIPGAQKNLQHHKYKVLPDFSLLKLTAVYGPNASGKSNLIRAIGLFQNLVLNSEVSVALVQERFHFKLEEIGDGSQLLAVEFIQDGKPFYYALQLKGGYVAVEELYKSGLGKKPDELLFERKTDAQGKISLRFYKAFEENEKAVMLKSLLEEEFLSPDKTAFRELANRQHALLGEVKTAFKWFKDTLRVVLPDAKPNLLTYRMEKDSGFKRYIEHFLCSLHVGIEAVSLETRDLVEFFSAEELKEVMPFFKEQEDRLISFRRLGSKKEIVLVREEGEIVVKQIKLEHKAAEGQSVPFDLEEESDGTIRLMELAPAFYELMKETKVYVVDELERSLHPLLIRELIEKFSLDEQTKGQLVFTTHESQLLDQRIFRQDEIWFAEKDQRGMTDLYSLDTFKPHKTINIRKGYLNGRYGAIPFLGDLQNLNWRNYASEKSPV